MIPWSLPPRERELKHVEVYIFLDADESLPPRERELKLLD